MKKLNRKGYMTVEIIIASVIAFSIAFFLMEITMKLVDVTDNEYVSTNFIADKVLITKDLKKRIMNDVRGRNTITDIKCNEDGMSCNITYGDGSNKKIFIEGKTIKYDTYQKQIDSELSGDAKITGFLSESKTYAAFNIALKNIFDDDDYNITFFVANIKQLRKYVVELDILGYYGETSTTIEFDNTDYGPSIDVYYNWDQSFYSRNSDTSLECYEDGSKKIKYDFETKETMRYQGYIIEFTTSIPDKLYCNFSEIY